MSPGLPRFLLLVLVAVTGIASTERRPEPSDDRCEDTQPAAKQNDQADRPSSPGATAAPSDHSASPSAPAQPPATAPARDAAKPSRPANKPRPAWPPPAELIS